MAISDHSSLTKIAEHVMNFLFEELHIAINARTVYFEDLLPINLVGALKMEFKLGKEHRSIIQRC